MRHAYSSSESLLAVVSTVQFDHAGEPVKIEARVGVASHLRTYSERRRDAIWRGCAFIEAFQEINLEEKAEIFSDEGTHWFGIPDPSGSWRIDIPLEGSRRRATRRFFEWASESIKSRVLQPQNGHSSLFLNVPRSHGIVRARLHHNLLNGSLLPDENPERFQQRYDHAFEWSLVRKCWKYRGGLADVEAEFGRPTLKFGPHDPSGTGLSSLEPIRDQWLFADLSERHVVIFREYDDGRLAVNLLDIESISYTTSC
jgi:hypothetical protein